MNENEVVDSICDYLTNSGYEISSKLRTNQRGIDVVAVDPTSREEIFVEAKGGTSSKEGTARFGKEYSASQVFDRVAKGVYTCLRLRGEYKKETHRIVLAVPESPRFEGYLNPVLPQLERARIEVWLVSKHDSSVRVLEAFKR